VGIDFSTWYARERDGVVRSLLVIGGDPDGARDAVAEAFSRAYERWPRVAAMGSPTGWVYRVALNEIRRRERRRRIEARLLQRRADPRPTAPPPEVDPELWDAVAALPRREREVVVLRYVADLREREVAEALGISEGAASTALVTARRRLARRLDPAAARTPTRSPRSSTDANDVNDANDALEARTP
jgi:RNA polymerase sigma-70 factor (ECF subfamily)